MKSHFLILTLIGTACSSSSPANIPPCEFLAPLATFKIAKGESLIQYPNGTLRIPMKGIASNERTSLYVNGDELFYYNIVGKKKTADTLPKELFGYQRTCKCMHVLHTKNLQSEFIRDQAIKICNQYRCESWRHNYFPTNKPWSAECLEWNRKGSFLEFEKLKEQMPMKKVAEIENGILKE